MNSVNTLIKWPGGKAREIKYIENLIPKFERYVEPFFGGGAMFFYLNPKKAIINDISHNLILFYRLAKEQNKEFEKYLRAYNSSFQGLISACDDCINDILGVYNNLKACSVSGEQANTLIHSIVDNVVKEAFCHDSYELVSDWSAMKKQIGFFALDKMQRTIKNEGKKPFSDADLKENLITGFASGYYMYFRGVYNSIAKQTEQYTNIPYNIANFYFVREYCYGSMFRYNSKGEFNIPYGGMSYNRKDFQAKIDNIFNANVLNLFSGTEISCSDFADFIEANKLVETDFMFLDPPYDTDFSDYEGKEFTKKDQARLADVLLRTKAKFILIIKNTDYIYSLYEKNFNILCFDKTYTYNVRSRNERNVEHLIITNMDI